MWGKEMANEFVQTMADARIDAKSLSGFMSEPSSVKVPRRLAPPINTLNYFLDYLRALELVYSQQTGVVNVNGVQVKAVAQAVKDALNSAAIDNNTQVDTLITATPKHVGAIARNQSEKNDDFIDIRDFTRPTDVDHTAGLKAAAAVALAQKKKLQGSGTYKIKSGDVSFRFIELELGACTFVVDKPYKVIIGGDAGTGLNPPQKIGNVQNPKTSFTAIPTATPTLRIMGAKNQSIKIGFVQELQFYQSTDPTTYPRDASQAYSTIDIDFAMVLTVDTDPRFDGGNQADGAGSANQWFNENTININRCYGFYLRGSYNHNHNIINGGSFEGVSIIRLERGNKNHFKTIRFEGTSNSVYFGENTLGNTIEKTWFGSEANFWLVPDLTDLGRMNSLRSVYDSKAYKRHIMSLTNSETVFNNVVQSGYNRTPSTKYIKSNSSGYNIVGVSNMFEVMKNDYLFVQINGDTNSFYTIRVYLYDINKQPVTNAVDVLTETNLKPFTNTNKFEKSVSNIARFALLDDSVKYLSVDILTIDDKTRHTARSIDVFVNSLRPMTENYYALVGQSNITKLVSAKPTEFFGSLGDTVQNKNGTRYICTHSIATWLTSTALADSTTIIVDRFFKTESGSTAVDDIIGIELDNNKVHWTTVSAISTNNITLAAALPSAASANNNVYISRLT